MIKKEGVSPLTNLIKALEETGLRLEQAYQKKDPIKFESEKKLILQIQRKISEVLK